MSLRGVRRFRAALSPRPSTRVRKTWNEQGRVCYICLQPVTLEEANHDHVVPQSKGGSNGAENLRLSHRKCNSARGNDDGRAWLAAHPNPVQSRARLLREGLLRLLSDEEGDSERA